MSTSSTVGRASGGKYGKRHCPALNAVISPGDCGAQRGSKLACPDDCPFFPFARAGFDLWYKVDNTWTAKAIDYVQGHLSLTRFQDLVRRLTIPMTNPRLELECAAQNALSFALFIERDAAGKTLAERWESENWAGLNNDERVMMRWRRQGRPTAIEAQRVIDAQSVECIDVLDPDAGPFRVLDRGLAAQMVRFSRVFTWLIRYPHFCRVAASAMEVPYTVWPEWRATIDQRHQQAREARPELTLKDFLAETIVETTALVTALGEKLHAQLLASLDFEHCLTVFRYTCPWEELERVFREKPDFIPDEEPSQASEGQPLAAYTWVRQGESATFDRDNPANAGAGADSSAKAVDPLGNVRVFDGQVAFDTFSKRKQVFVRQMVERYFGPLLTFDQEIVRNLATIMAERERRERTLASVEHLTYGPAGGLVSETPSPAPPVTSAEPESAPAETRAEKHLQNYRRFLEESIPALGGLTPRAAAADPEKRPQLIELLKQHLRDLELRNREHGSNLELDWLLEELGLRELL